MVVSESGSSTACATGIGSEAGQKAKITKMAISESKCGGSMIDCPSRNLIRNSNPVVIEKRASLIVGQVVGLI